MISEWQMVGECFTDEGRNAKDGRSFWPGSFHRGFDVFCRIGNSRREQLSAILSDAIHIFQEKSLPVDRGNRLKIDGSSFLERPNHITGREVCRVYLPVRDILALRPEIDGVLGANFSPQLDD